MILDIVICNYRTPDDLERCLDSLTQNSPTVPFEVFVVNNDPTPADEAIVDRYPQWRHMKFRDNVGYAKACNAAARLGQGEVIGFFNADVEFTPHVLDVCHNALVSHRNDCWGVLGPRQVDSGGRITHAGIFGTQAAPRHRGWRARRGFEDVRDDAVSVSGSAYFVLRDVWDELTNCATYAKFAPQATGAFLPTFHYFEETWCSYHAVAHGHKVVYFGSCTMIHEWHQASPVGGHVEKQMPEARQMFRAACDYHGIPHD